jgi:enterochelin esterase-like enzyme
MTVFETRRPQGPGERTGRSRYRLRLWPVWMALLTATLSSPRTLPAGKVVLKSGFEIPGSPVSVPGMTGDIARGFRGQNVPISPFWMIDDGIRRYFVHRQNVRPGMEGVDQSDDSSRYVTFDLEHLRSSSDKVPVWIGAFVEVEPWDEYGRCRVTLATPNGSEDIHLAITKVDPRVLSVISTSHTWEFGLSPAMLPLETLRAILRNAIDAGNPDDRLAIIRFFILSEQFSGARAEIDELKTDFPELEVRADELSEQLRDRYGLLAIDAMRQRRAIGQHHLARRLAVAALGEDLNAATLLEAQSFLDEYLAADDRMRLARAALQSLQAELPPEEAAAVAVLRSAVDRELGFDTLPRLEPFLLVVDDDTLTPAEKLALAYSGWLLGPSDARTALPEALSLWDARDKLLQLLHPDADPGDQKLIIREIAELEGVTTESLSSMIPLLPSPVEYERSDQARQIDIQLAPNADSDELVHYSVLLPPEYDPLRAYPAIVALRAEGRTTGDMLSLWGGTPESPGHAQRQGYIVIAPDYASAETGDYDYSARSHDIVQRALFDARQRFHLDSDRVFLSGHGMGGDAAFDIGLSHPDLWAGVIPFTGRFQHAAALEERNALALPFYVVAGEHDRDTLQVNDSPVSGRMQAGSDIVYCDYKARGFESYADELPRLFDWMRLHRREHVDREFEHKIVNAFDNRVGWVKWLDLPPALSQPVLWGGASRPPRAYLVSGKITEGNTTHNVMYVTRHPGKRTAVWLSPEYIDYDKRVKIYVNGTNVFNDFAKPSVPDLLEDFRDRGDREMLYWTKFGF